ncbi:MAG: AAA family ATPase [Bacteroidetes bacterium]|nr:AAA family ATPase [Bacteroidota bacterium]
MKISRLKLKNIKCFKDIDISFEDESGDIKNWSLFVGDNGDGKTTILRCLALGLCDQGSASGLLLELFGEYIQRGEEKGIIEVNLKDDDGELYRIHTSIMGDNESVSRTILDSNEDEISDKDLPREKIFAAAYGAGRSITGTESYDQYAIVDAVYPLFNYRDTLQNAELGASRVKIYSDNEWQKLEKTLKEILLFHEDDKISFGKTGLYVERGKGNEMFNSLSDGYQSLTSVILDFVSWNLLYREDEDFEIDNFSGIFIIDEIEQHLHPKWQREIVKILSEQFPNVQFLCSTNTPICALGLSDLESGSCLFKTTEVNGHCDIEEFDLQENFKGYRADQILTSSIFDLTDTRSISIENKLETYAQIYLKKESERTAQEMQTLKAIEDELKNLPMWDSVIDKQQRQKLIELLENERINA